MTVGDSQGSRTSPDRRWFAGMWAMIVKDFREVLRDGRTMSLLIVSPVAMLVLFGYAANFSVDKFKVEVMGPGAAQVAQYMTKPLQVSRVDSAATRDDAVTELRKGKADVIFLLSASGPPVALIDGSALFTAQGALLMVHQVPGVKSEVLFNPSLKTSWWMVPAMSGLIMNFIGTFITSMGLVKERQDGTLEQLAVMPFRPVDVITGKIAPYFVIAAIDMVLVTVLGAALFRVPFAGSVGLFALASAVFLFVVLGLGVLISAVSRTQFQAVQTAILAIIPQVLLTGMFFPLNAVPSWVRWISYFLPLTHYTDISRAVMLRGAPFSALWPSILILLVMAVVIVGAAILAFRRELAPNVKHAGAHEAHQNRSKVKWPKGTSVS